MLCRVNLRDELSISGSSCTQELQALFGCLKKWEFDDKPCSKQHSSYMDCVHEAENAAKEFKEAATKVGFLSVYCLKIQDVTWVPVLFASLRVVVNS